MFVKSFIAIEVDLRAFVKWRKKNVNKSVAETEECIPLLHFNKSNQMTNCLAVYVVNGAIFRWKQTWKYRFVWWRISVECNCKPFNNCIRCVEISLPNALIFSYWNYWAIRKHYLKMINTFFKYQFCLHFISPILRLHKCYYTLCKFTFKLRHIKYTVSVCHRGNNWNICWPVKNVQITIAFSIF